MVKGGLQDNLGWFKLPRSVLLDLEMTVELSEGMNCCCNSFVCDCCQGDWDVSPAQDRPETTAQTIGYEAKDHYCAAFLCVVDV